MPGSFGTNDKDNGVFANTKASDKVGVFGSNEATAPPAGGGAGGAGVFGLSVSPGAAGVFGANTSAKGVGVQGNGPEVGVSGFSKDGVGVRGNSTDGFAAVHGNGGKNGVWGYTLSANDSGVYGSNDGSGMGVAGFSKNGTGVRGTTQSSANFGIYGSNDSPNAPTGGGAGGAGVFGLSNSPGGAGVFGANNGSKGVGVQGNGPEVGVSGFSKDGFGVRGNSADGFAAVHGNGGKNGVWGYTVSANDSGVFGSNDGSGYGVAGFSKNGIGVLGRGGKLAGRFEGDVEVTGDIRLVNADCAEDFDIAADILVEAGTVMALGNDGSLYPSQVAYDKRVAGVVPGAGGYKPGIVLDKQQSDGNRQPIALLGKVYCKVDASFRPVEIGDLLTTSPTPGHAMKATDQLKAFGAVIGKALRPLETGQELIPILIALQ